MARPLGYKAHGSLFGVECQAVQGFLALSKVKSRTTTNIRKIVMERVVPVAIARPDSEIIAGESKRDGASTTGARKMRSYERASLAVDDEQMWNASARS